MQALQQSTLLAGGRVDLQVTAFNHQKVFGPATGTRQLACGRLGRSPSWETSAKVAGLILLSKWFVAITHKPQFTLHGEGSKTVAVRFSAHPLMFFV